MFIKQMSWLENTTRNTPTPLSANPSPKPQVPTDGTGSHDLWRYKEEDIRR